MEQPTDITIPPLEKLVHLFKVLGDETRLKIVYLLLQQEMPVGSIARALGSSDSNISHHLRLLRDARLVKHQRRGKKIYYSLDDDHVDAIIDQGLKHASHT